MAGALRIVVAGGGTGGHLFPGLATAREISRRRPDADILFITGARRMESQILDRSGFRQASIDVEGLKGKNIRKAAATLLGLPRGYRQARRLLKSFSPSVVFGVGGYSSGPVCLAARRMHIPSAVHEQNSYPGLTNRILGRLVDRIFISFEESRSRFPREKTVFTGNPVREEIIAAGGEAAAKEGPLNLLVVGGSQGAAAVSTAVVDALEVLRDQGRSVRVVHQTGTADYPRVLKLYTEKGLLGSVSPFIDDMAEAYSRSDLVIARAGAGTISELAVLGKPSILIPFPFAANDHQTTNAKALSDAGGADLLPQSDLNGRRLAELVSRYDDDREALRRLGLRAREKAAPGAARAIVDGLEALMGMEQYKAAA